MPLVFGKLLSLQHVHAIRRYYTGSKVSGAACRTHFTTVLKPNNPPSHSKRSAPQAGTTDGELAVDPDRARTAKLKVQERAKGVAARIAIRRPHSEQELKQKLADREFDDDSIQAALDSLQNVGLQSDKEYAGIVARSKWRQGRWAPSRIKMELSRKGLSQDDIENGLREVFGDDMRLHVDLEDDLELSDMERHLLHGVKIQADMSAGLPRDKRQRRLVMWLQRRGHNWDTISKLLRQVDLGFR